MPGHLSDGSPTSSLKTLHSIAINNPLSFMKHGGSFSVQRSVPGSTVN